MSSSTDITVRPLAARDSLDALTALLHRAYAPLAALGMSFRAASQPVELTRQRAAEGHCLVAEHGGELIGTVTVCGPHDVETAPWTPQVPWFRERGTAHFHQFAVDPPWQGRGVGRRLVQAAEAWARDYGCNRMALETAEGAEALAALYRRMGYAEVTRVVQFEGRRYPSTVMLKSLDRSPVRELLETMARYNAWALARLFEHVDALPDADYRRDLGLFFRSVHGTLNHLLIAEHHVWRRRFAEGESPSVKLNAEVEADRATLRAVLTDGALAWKPLIAVWPEERLQGTLSYKRLAGQPVTLPFAATLLHVFNHATHHRGQVTAGLTTLGRPAPELDLVFMLQAESALIQGSRRDRP